MENRLDCEIRQLLGRDSFALIGAGRLGEMAIDLWPESVPKPKFILDSNKTGTCRGIEIVRLQDHQPDSSVTYLLSAFKLSSAKVMEIFDLLGQHMVLTVYDLFEHHCPSKFSNGWRCLDSGEGKLARIQAARACFFDRRSVSVFDAAVAWRYHRELVPEFACEPEDSKYDLNRFSMDHSVYAVVLDCGAYDLSFAKNLVRARIKVESYIAFEPDDLNFARCLDSMRTLDSLVLNTIALERSAVFDKTGEMIFLNLGLLSSRLVSAADAKPEGACKTVHTTPLDEYFARRFDVNRSGRVLIKLHVEGAELQALLGAEKLIRSLGPDILLNLSHDEDSLLEIPLYLKDKLNYKLMLIGHSLFGEGLTLVATINADSRDGS